MNSNHLDMRETLEMTIIMCKSAVQKPQAFCSVHLPVKDYSLSRIINLAKRDSSHSTDGIQNLREQCKILAQYSLHESMCSSVENPKPRMTPKGVSRAEVQQGLEECAALIAATALLPSEPQHKMLSNSTSHSCKLCCVALLCHALLWVSQSMAFRA